MPVSGNDLLDAFEFASASPIGQRQDFLCKGVGPNLIGVPISSTNWKRRPMILRAAKKPLRAWCEIDSWTISKSEDKYLPIRERTRSAKPLAL